MQSDDQAGIGWGGRRGGAGGRREALSPLMILIAINVGVFVLQYVFGLGGTLVRERGIETFLPWGEASRELVFGQGQVWTLVTYMFVHGSLLHILFNIIIIYSCGRAVLAMVGRRHFLRIYFLAGLLGGVLQIFLWPNPVVGASACGFGLLVALATLLPEQQVTMLLYFIIPVRLRLKYLAYGLVGISVLFMVIGLVAGAGADVPMVSGVAHAAHLGGALVGFLYIRLSGLGGVKLTREGLADQRAKSERRGMVASRSKAKRRRTVTASEVKKSRRAGADFVSAEIDPILDKINREGFGSLSDEEREVLDAGSQKISDSANSK